MNKVIKTIVTRRSIRKYTEEKIPTETLELLLLAAMNAPSACNQQAWYFIVVTDQDKLDKLSTLHSGVEFVKNAPAAIIVCSEPNATILDYYWIDECAAATQNLLLAAHSLGLGAIWTGINHENLEDINFYRNILNISDQYTPFAMIPIGHPAEQRVSVNKYNDKKILWN